MGLHVVDHPLVADALARLRDRETTAPDFRAAMARASAHLFHEATVDLPLEAGTVRTPMDDAPARRLREGTLTLVPILRAGLGMLAGVLPLAAGARVCHLGVRRNEETAEPVEYYRNLPADAAGTMAFVLDPMLATGGTLCHALEILEEMGMAEIRVLCIVAAPEGIRAVREAHPEVEIYAASVDEGLDENHYIVPGLGDAGDRTFDTGRL